MFWTNCQVGVSVDTCQKKRLKTRKKSPAEAGAMTEGQA